MAFHYRLTAREVEERKTKRIQVVCDFVKTSCFGCVGISVLAPAFGIGNFGAHGVATLAVAGVILGSMVWNPHWLK